MLHRFFPPLAWALSAGFVLVVSASANCHDVTAIALFTGILTGGTNLVAESPVVEAETIAQAHDLAKACEYLTGLPDPAASASAFHSLVRRSWQIKNVPAMIQYGQAGIQFALQTSAKLGDGEAKLATQLRGLAKSIAYDVSSNLWPGWDEPGITLNATDLAIGLQLARANLRLARELDRKGAPLGHAWWLLGAHELASRNHTAAVAAFETAQAEYAGDYALMALGYACLAQQFTKHKMDRAEATQNFEKTVKSLRGSTGPDGKFFASQLETAAKVFRKDLPPLESE